MMRVPGPTKTTRIRPIQRVRASGALSPVDNPYAVIKLSYCRASLITTSTCPILVITPCNEIFDTSFSAYGRIIKNERVELDGGESVNREFDNCMLVFLPCRLHTRRRGRSATAYCKLSLLRVPNVDSTPPASPGSTGSISAPTAHDML
jgi:hypothetical protein